MKVVSSPREEICSPCMVNQILATHALKTSVIVGTTIEQSLFLLLVSNVTNTTAKDVFQMMNVMTAMIISVRRV